MKGEMGEGGREGERAKGEMRERKEGMSGREREREGGRNGWRG